MLDMTKTYDDFAQKKEPYGVIRELVWYAKEEMQFQGHKPTAFLIGDEQYRQLARADESRLFIPAIDSLRPQTLWGLELFLVNRKSYLGVA